MSPTTRSASAGRTTRSKLASSGSSTNSQVTPIDSKPYTEMLKQLHCLGKRTHALLASLSLSDLDNIPEVTKALWTESTTTWPQLLRSDDCWTAPPPPVTDIILATLDALSEKKNDTTINFVAYRRGGSDASHDPRLAVAQLSEPNASNTAAIIGLNLDLLPEGIFESSPALSEFAEPFDESEQNLTLTPKYWVTDLHLDSADGISSPMGSCVKIWVAFPPTENNLALMRKAEGQKAKLTRIGKQLEGGVIFRTDSTQAVYLPVGTLHAVYTIHGGFLIGIDLTTPTSSRTYAKMMAEGLDGNARFQEAIFDRFLLSIDLGLDNNRVSLAIQAWLDAWEWTEEWAAGHREWARDAAGVWDEFLGKTVAKKMTTCPCGMEGGSFVKHFRETHFIKSPEKKRKRRPGFVGGKSSDKPAKRRKK